MDFHSVIPFFSRCVITFIAQRFPDLCPCAVGTTGHHDRNGIHGKFTTAWILGNQSFHPYIRKHLESPCDPIQTAAESLVAGKFRKPV